MKAVVLQGRGGPEVVASTDVPDLGPPRGDEILVRVRASSVNGTDLGLRRGGLPAPLVRRRPFVLGFDLSGVVVACGPKVTAFAPGDEVVALLGHGGGGQAEHALLRQGRAASAPRGVPASETAGLPLAGLTALQALHRRAQLHRRPGARVLVVGASGGIGAFAVQLAVLAGARVTGTASAGKRDFVAALGAEDVVGHDAIRGTYDVVLDSPGALPAAAARRLLAPGGVLVSTHPASVQSARGLLASALGGPGYTVVATSARSADLARLVRLVETGRLRVPVDRVFPLADPAGAHSHLESGRAAGKVVLAVADEPFA
ncbi:NADP-dependent oxidoreductase [Lentzea albida]|uniref:NADPH:quinone reductase n=1 Tax=Lentzea albida TaxID=65499 RepID=A0A1H9EP65_9PSEU|nr:NADP-dependent oxidoreductase [Lentzea albida]SEQ27013.1 NADPH:quinone reductase [Lentzea albida]